VKCSFCGDKLFPQALRKTPARWPCGCLAFLLSRTAYRDLDLTVVGGSAPNGQLLLVESASRLETHQRHLIRRSSLSYYLSPLSCQRTGVNIHFSYRRVYADVIANKDSNSDWKSQHEIAQESSPTHRTS